MSIPPKFAASDRCCMRSASRCRIGVSGAHRAAHAMSDGAAQTHVRSATCCSTRPTRRRTACFEAVPGALVDRRRALHTYDPRQRSPRRSECAPSCRPARACCRGTCCGCSREPAAAGRAAALQRLAAEWPAFVEAFIEARFKADPYFAVQAGRHEFDGQMPDWSRAALDARRQRACADFAGELAKFEIRPR